MTGKRRGRPAVPAAAADASIPEKADAAVARAVAPYAETLPIRMLSTFSKLGDQPPMLAISGAVLASGILVREPRLARAGVRMIAAHLLATAAKNMVKRRIDRTRPKVLVKEGRYKMRPGDSRAKEQTSFPSGHSAGAVAVAAALAREYPEYRLPALAAGGAIAIAQIPRCTHYPTDVVAGSSIGAISALATGAVIDRLLGAPPAAEGDEDADPRAAVRRGSAVAAAGGFSG
jgi:membrane-associated phospholipid phosphatase